MYIGQKAICEPQTFYEIDASCKKVRRIMTGKIGYIHPNERYIMVEFATKGGIIRECFKPNEVQLGK